MFAPRYAFVAFAGAAILNLASASCPNKCSGHGTCGADDVCSCQQNWVNGDCSGRACPYSYAWVDVASRADTAHTFAECSNHGSCDRASGECQCDEGYTGRACERMSCPNDCSGHGTCEFIDELAAGASTSYGLWDAEKIMGCVCDGGYVGHNCGSKICPKGDDPVTTQAASGAYQSSMTQVIDAGAADAKFALTYVDPYGHSFTTEEIDATNDNTGATNIQDALRALPNHALDGIAVRYVANTNLNDVDRTTTSIKSASDGGIVDLSNTISANVFLVTFPSADLSNGYGPGTSGHQNLMTCVKNTRTSDGFHPYVDGTATCDVYEVVEDASYSGSNKYPLGENQECSNRGVCNQGLCECFDGHRGIACEHQEALI